MGLTYGAPGGGTYMFDMKAMPRATEAWGTHAHSWNRQSEQVRARQGVGVRVARPHAQSARSRGGEASCSIHAVGYLNEGGAPVLVVDDLLVEIVAGQDELVDEIAHQHEDHHREQRDRQEDEERRLLHARARSTTIIHIIHGVGEPGARLKARAPGQPVGDSSSPRPVSRGFELPRAYIVHDGVRHGDGERDERDAPRDARGNVVLLELRIRKKRGGGCNLAVSPVR